MLKCSTPLWLADLSKLADEMKHAEPHCERFHLDVADGQYVKTMFFSPDLVKALRPHSKLPFEVHLMVADPMAWIEPFSAAGADIIIFCFNAAKNPGDVMNAIRSHQKKAGVSLLLNEPIDLLEPHWKNLDLVDFCGADLGAPDAELGTANLEKIRVARDIVFQRGLSVELEAEGGVRRETASLLKGAGVDFVVPGPILFKENSKRVHAWLADL